MKILFIEAFSKTTEPMSIMLLSALAKQKGHSTFLHIFLSNENLTDVLEKINPDIVAYSAMTGDHKYLVEANKIVKSFRKEIFTILGGRHPTFFPEIINYTNFDAVCVGEGDDAWPELLDAIENKKSIKNIPNIMTRENFWKLKLCPRKDDLDNLPFLDYELCYEKIPLLGKSLKRTLMTSRGCPYNCSYCFNHIYNQIYKNNGPIVTRQSVDRVIAEAKYVISRWPTKFIKFYDDDFVLKLDDWLVEFSEKWSKEIGLPFHCLLRANVVAREPEIFKFLKKAGVQSVSMSVESGNDYIRNKLFNRNMSKDQMEKAFKAAWDLGIYTFSNTILGVPISKREENKFDLPSSIKRDIESIDFNIKIKATMTEYPILFPYPKTAIGEYCVENGFFDNDFDKLTISYQNKSPMNCFSDKEKMVQQNLALLGTVLQAFAGSRSFLIRSLTPFFRFLALNILAKLPLGKLYLLPYVIVLNYLHKKKIYAYQKISFSELIKTILESYRFNLAKQFEK